MGASCHSSQCLRRNIPMLDLGWDGGLCRMGPSFSRLWLCGSCHMRLKVPDEDDRGTKAPPTILVFRRDLVRSCSVVCE